jgi:DNA topoisomerase-1
VTELKAALKDADELYLATDGDREGEAIAWHLLEVLKPKVPVYRMTFGEITKEAIQRAMGNLRDVDTALVDAQETRRVLDRLYGYEISPVLWRKVARGLSAGRVQSVVTRMVVDRERERMAFKAASYWDLTGQFGADAGSFKAKLASVDGAKVASGRDFNDDGVLTSKNVAHLNEELATSLAAGLQNAEFRVRSVDTKPYTPPPGGALHHLHAAAGGGPQAAVLLQEHHAGGPAPVRKRLHHLYAYGLVLVERRSRHRCPPPGL